MLLLVALAACASAATTVTTFEALEDAIENGAAIDIAADLDFPDEIKIPTGVTVTIESSTRATLTAVGDNFARARVPRRACFVSRAATNSDAVAPGRPRPCSASTAT